MPSGIRGLGRIILDLVLKQIVALALAVLIWLPLKYCLGLGIWWLLGLWAIISPLLLGLFDCCDVFGLERWLGD